MQYVVAPNFMITLIPKVGTRTLLHTLVRNPSYEFKAVQTGNISDVNTNARLKIIFIRDPYSRLLSCYINKIKFAAPVIKNNFWPLYQLRDMSFEDFVYHIQECPRDEHWRPQVDYVKSLNHDVIGTLENMQQVMNGVMKRLEIPHTFDMPHLNYSDDKKVTYSKRKQYLDKRKEEVNEVKMDKYYTDELREIVRKMYRRDFDMYESIHNRI